MTQAHETREHSELSASGAYRWMACPGSVQLCRTVPAKPSSSYALEGTAAHELAENPVLTERVIQDLNANPVLHWASDTFDAAIVTVSVQYLTSPAAVFAEVGRVLKPGAPFAVSYSNRCFPTKAVAVWQSLNSREHAELIGVYFRLSAAFGPPGSSSVT